MHDGTISLDWPPDDVVAIFEVDDEDFGRGRIVFLVADADVGIRL